MNSLYRAILAIDYQDVFFFGLPEKRIAAFKKEGRATADRAKPYGVDTIWFMTPTKKMLAQGWKEPDTFVHASERHAGSDEETDLFNRLGFDPALIHPADSYCIKNLASGLPNGTPVLSHPFMRNKPCAFDLIGLQTSLCITATLTDALTQPAIASCTAIYDRLLDRVKEISAGRRLSPQSHRQLLENEISTAPSRACFMTEKEYLRSLATTGNCP